MRQPGKHLSEKRRGWRPGCEEYNIQVEWNRGSLRGQLRRGCLGVEISHSGSQGSWGLSTDDHDTQVMIQQHTFILFLTMSQSLF